MSPRLIFAMWTSMTFLVRLSFAPERWIPAAKCIHDELDEYEKEHSILILAALLRAVQFDRTKKDKKLEIVVLVHALQP